MLRHQLVAHSLPISVVTLRRAGSKVLFACSLTLLLGAADCNASSSASPTIRIDQQRNHLGVLTGLGIDGSGFTPNGSVRINYFFRSLQGSTVPVEGTTITAKSDGAFHFEHQPVCPDLSQFEVQRGSFSSVVANDVESGKSGIGELHRGRESDCVGF